VLINQLKKIIKPFRLLSLLTTYTLGLGLVQYVREMRSWLLAIQGALFLLLMVLGVETLALLGNLRNQIHTNRDLPEKQIQQLRRVLALIGATLLTMAMAVFIGWMVGGILRLGLTGLILAAVFSCLFYFVTSVSPSFNLYRILAEVLVFVIIPPAMAFFIQSANPHRLLTLTVFPFVAAYLTYPLLLSLKNFSEDQRTQQRTPATEIGWEKTMVFHNALILMAYLLFALIALLDFPWFLLWPVFLTLPIGLVEIWLMERVRRGGKPLWSVMQFATASIYFIPMYLIGFAFWIR
jgi:1,4-dihydroxy-2-naphthoate octaprenyltransferase